MKLLVSDYDNTIEVDSVFRNPHIPKGTIQGIKDFMHDGNMFMISTARPYESIMSEINENRIPYDFVSSLNGCIVHDSYGNLIFSKDLIKLDIDELHKLYSCIDKIELIKDKDRDLYYTFKTKLFTCSKKLIEHLEKSGLDVQSWFMNTYSIAHPVSNKVDSINFIQKKLNIDESDIITVGDSSDDLKMIQEYYSYGIIKTLPDLNILENCNKKVKSLKGALKDINKNI